MVDGMLLAQFVQLPCTAYAAERRVQPQGQQDSRIRRRSSGMAFHRRDPLEKGRQVQAADVLPDDPGLMAFRQQVIQCHGPKFDLSAIRAPQPRTSPADGPFSRRTLLWQREQHPLLRSVFRWSVRVMSVHVQCCSALPDCCPGEIQLSWLVMVIYSQALTTHSPPPGNRPPTPLGCRKQTNHRFHQTYPPRRNIPWPVTPDDVFWKIR